MSESCCRRSARRPRSTLHRLCCRQILANSPPPSSSLAVRQRRYQSATLQHSNPSWLNGSCKLRGAHVHSYGRLTLACDGQSLPGARDECGRRCARRDHWFAPLGLRACRQRRVPRRSCQLAVASHVARRADWRTDRSLKKRTNCRP
eukprot:7391521-Prymnesium_polylepis.4